MKNYFKLMSLFLGMALCTTAFVACGSDDDDTPATSNGGNNGGNNSGNNGGTTTETGIEGTWKIELNNTLTVQNQTTSFSYKESMTFNTDGTFKSEATETNTNWHNADRLEGSWKKLGTDKVIVTVTKRYTIGQDNVEQLDSNFAEKTDTLGYFFKGNALFCETPSVNNEGYFAYTRTGALPFSGFGDYAGNPILGSWVGEDFAWDGTPITNKLELRSDGTFFQTMDNHRGWSEGTAGYYILKNNSIMLISYYFISKMGSETDDWEVVGYRMWGGQWSDYTINGDILSNPGAESMHGDMDVMVREGKEIGSSPVGHWKRTIEFWNNNQMTSEDEYWELESNGTARHWWVGADGKFREGTVGTYTLKEETNHNDGTTVTAIVCHWDNWLADSGDATNPQIGNTTGSGEQDYTLRYVYSKITDVLLVQWTGSTELYRFKRIN